MRRVPSARSCTRPTSFRTRRCWDTAGRLTGNADARVVTDAGRSHSIARIARRDGSPRASAKASGRKHAFAAIYGKSRRTHSRTQARTPHPSDVVASTHPGSAVRGRIPQSELEDNEAAPIRDGHGLEPRHPCADLPASASSATDANCVQIVTLCRSGRNVDGAVTDPRAI